MDEIGRSCPWHFLPSLIYCQNMMVLSASFIRLVLCHLKKRQQKRRWVYTQFSTAMSRNCSTRRYYQSVKQYPMVTSAFRCSPITTSWPKELSSPLTLACWMFARSFPCFVFYIIIIATNKMKFKERERQRGSRRTGVYPLLTGTPAWSETNLFVMLTAARDRLVSAASDRGR